MAPHYEDPTVAVDASRIEIFGTTALIQGLDPRDATNLVITGAPSFSHRFDGCVLRVARAP